MRFGRPSPALFISILALVISMSGVSYAAIQIPRNSVGAPQLKKNAVITKKLKNGAVNGAKVKDGTVTGADVATNSLTGADINEATLVTPGGVRRFSGFDFTPRASTSTFAYGGSGSIYRTAGSDFFTVRLDLPQGATITDIKFYLQDNDGATSISAFLSRYEPATFGISDLASGTSINVAGVQTLTLTPGAPIVVDNTKYVYELLASPSATTSANLILGAAVKYGPSLVGTTLPRSIPLRSTPSER